MLLRHAQEIVKSAQSFEYFCENYLKIVSPTQGLLNFSLLPHQKRLAEAYDENRFVILSKWRNGGLVTTTLACSTKTKKYSGWLPGKETPWPLARCSTAA